ncbi:hypothetical protein B7P43_G11949 [Cryptotermes secundus]|uniref:C2H2-type domain-containing protein n=1 Tax=Cryptotermes secundus TaxID=105785 RepID=A0A2J7R9V6_9NEOP|nr:hypothetical protein B7P43_G11949 [Cryptotermes secundus]
MAFTAYYRDFFYLSSSSQVETCGQTNKEEDIVSPVMILYVPILQGNYNKAPLVLSTLNSITTPITATGNCSNEDTELQRYPLLAEMYIEDIPLPRDATKHSNTIVLTASRARRYAESFRCQRCGNFYTYKKNLLRHLNLECGKEPQFQCLNIKLWNKLQDVLPASFAEMQLQMTSTRSVVSKSNIPFRCPRCYKCYQYKNSLSRHMRLECGKEPQFQCPFCPHSAKHRKSSSSWGEFHHLPPPLLAQNMRQFYVQDARIRLQKDINSSLKFSKGGPSPLRGIPPSRMPEVGRLWIGSQGPSLGLAEVHPEYDSTGTVTFKKKYREVRKKCIHIFWLISIQSIPFHPIPVSSILMLSTHLCLGLPSGIFPSGFPTDILYGFLISSIHATCHAHLILLHLINILTVDSLPQTMNLFSPELLSNSIYQPYESDNRFIEVQQETYPCPQCGNKYRHRQNLKRHLVYELMMSHVTSLLGHTSQNWFTSNQLPNTAHSRSASVANMNVQKTGDLCFPCHKCQKVYTWKANLNRHLRLECGKQPHLKCPYCMYITNRKTSVQEHIRRRHKNLPNIT